jgi:hypothetical protein
MGKPWGRYEIGYVRHAKFLALSGNAFALWWEAKNYCDEHHNDGMFPRAALRTFRFNSPKSVDMLTRSCGPKPNGEPYSALWDALDIGGVPHFRMHDYLEHNDCRDEVMARMEAANQRAELRKHKNKERQAAFRDRVTNALRNADRNAPVTPVTLTPTETETPTETKRTKNPSGGAKAPDSPTQQFLKWFQEEYTRRRNGAKYLVTWDKHGALVKRMLGAAELDELKIYAQIMLSDKCEDEFICSSDRGIEILNAKFSWLSERYAAWKAKREATA